MTFKEWCFKQYGIMEITEGKIINYQFLPLTSHPVLQQNSHFLINAYGAVPLKKDGQIIGYSFTNEMYTRFAQMMKLHYNVTLKAEEYRQPAPLYFQISADKQQIFSQNFFGFLPSLEYNPLTNDYRYKMHSQALNFLIDSYRAECKPVNDLTQLSAFKAIEHSITQNGLTRYLDKAQKLALDYSNTDEINCGLHESSSAYAISLQTYAELHKGILSPQQYTALKYTVELLAHYNQQGHLYQGLKSDSNFIEYLVPKVNINSLKSDGSFPLISELANGQQLKNIINQNAHDLLHGNPHANLGRNKPLKMRRFLPDDHMKSETNEIILQTGGMIDHSSITRIIKVGMLKNGTQAAPGQTPYYFNYFKIDTNLGAGFHDYEKQYKTCMGTYITQLHPTIRDKKGTLHNSIVNPLQNPQEYQRQMEHTLTELIKAEREICFYREPQIGPNNEDGAPANSAETREWTRLNKKRMMLSGTPVTVPVSFPSYDHQGRIIMCTVQNQRGYVQEGGSCPIFSIKQLVTSIIGSELASLHSQFLQTHNGAQHLKLIQDKIRTLEHSKNNLASAKQTHALNSLIGQIVQYNKISPEESKILESSLENRPDNLKLSLSVIKDLRILSQFYQSKMKLAQDNHFDDAYKSSIKKFYKKAISIRLSQSSIQDQAEQMKMIAHDEFSHRHSFGRLLTDIVLMIGTLFGAGLGRVLTGHTFFWSNAPTARETEIANLAKSNQKEDTVLSSLSMGA